MATKKAKANSLVREHKKAERELAKKGKKPFYIKKCELFLPFLSLTGTGGGGGGYKARGPP